MTIASAYRGAVTLAADNAARRIARWPVTEPCPVHDIVEDALDWAITGLSGDDPWDFAPGELADLAEAVSDLTRENLIRNPDRYAQETPS